jgi:hypothetical protein
MGERRNHDRVGLSTVAVVLARHNPGIAMVIEDISLGGARLAGPGTFQKDEQVQILFEIGGVPMEVAAEVVRVEHEDILSDRIAVRFLALAPEQRNTIRGLVRETPDVEDLLGAEVSDE